MGAHSRLTAEQWAEVRNERETRNTSYRILGQIYGVSSVAIGKRAKAEGWAEAQPSTRKGDGQALVDLHPAETGALVRRIAKEAFEAGYALGRRHAMLEKAMVSPLVRT